MKVRITDTLVKIQNGKGRMSTCIYVPEERIRISNWNKSNNCVKPADHHVRNKVRGSGVKGRVTAEKD